MGSNPRPAPGLVAPASLAGMLLAAALLTGCSGDDGEGITRAAPETPAASTSAAATPSAAPSRPAPTGSPTRGRTAAPRTPPPDTARPSVAIRTLPPADVGERVQISRNVVVTISNVRTQRVSGTGPGEIAGDAVVFTVEVRNGTEGVIDVGGFAVTASYGANVPAIPSDAAPSDPLTGRLSPGGVATGTYVFRMPADQVGTLKVEVSSNTSPNIVVFVR